MTTETTDPEVTRAHLTTLANAYLARYLATEQNDQGTLDAGARLATAVLALDQVDAAKGAAEQSRQDEVLIKYHEDIVTRSQTRLAQLRGGGA